MPLFCARQFITCFPSTTISSSPPSTMKMTANLSSSLFILLLLFLLQTICECDAKNQMMNCSSSACGVISNISFPFRLKDDPKHCGFPNPDYELACENNVTMIDLNSQKFHVKAINYDIATIWLGHVSIKNNMTCSFPEYSVYRNNFSSDYRSPYTTDIYPNLFNYSAYGYNFSSHHSPYRSPYDISWPINFMSCPYPLKNSSLLTETTDCGSEGGRHSYIWVGHMNSSDVNDMCRVDKIVLTSWKFKDPDNNVSLSEIHESLLYGFQLSWDSFPCRECNGEWQCLYDGVLPTCSNHLLNIISEVWRHIRYSDDDNGPDGPSAAILLAVLLILVVLFAGVSIAGLIIIAIICASTFVLLHVDTYYTIRTDTYWAVAHLRLIIVIFFSLRLLIVFPYMLWILIYKFQRSRLSRFDAIEDFLQSDNKLMPIRYSYSDIKRMTRGFREKLGQGGYGSVYKGKLRSGHDVAVKLLGKTGGNGQDFMNEIATIGRIHHFNVVKLVGFCAQGSKRALIFDFMPNGSLEKYIFNRDNMNSLSWAKKYEIAVGVARGIEYLHRGCDIQILHFDIKPHNILLDDKFIPKISDFGLAKVCSTDKKTVTLPAARGTIGYVAPELINRGIGGVSHKADVYSFGMLLMEMVGLNKDLTGHVASSSKYFPCWIYDCFGKRNYTEIWKIVDENEDDCNNDGNRKIARKMTIVALWCVQMSPDSRPSMNKVLEMLQADVERLQIPNRQSQSPQVAVNADGSWTTTYSTNSFIYHDTVPNVEIVVETN